MLLALIACQQSPSPFVLRQAPGSESEEAGAEELTLATTASPPPPSRPGQETLLLNELMSRNDSSWMTADGSFPDFVEVYNASDVAVDLSRVAIQTDGGLWAGATGSVPAGGYAVLDAFGGMDADGDHVDLLVDGAIVDSVATGRLDGDVEWARYPDGQAWQLSARATPGWTNGSSPGTSVDPSDRIYTFDHIEEFWVTLPADSYASLEADPYTEVPGSLAWQNVYFPDVSVRRKGVYGSLRSLSQKVGLKIDMNEYVDARLRGIETFSFNNMVQDPSYIHEAFTYEVFRAVGVPAPRVGYLKLYLNGEYIGLYANVESVDDTFLARWFTDNTGNLYEGAYGVDFYDGYETYFECDECANPDDRSDITAVTTALNQPASPENYAALSELVDMDEFLKYMAVEAMLWHWDGYTTSNNYRVYHDPRSGKFSIIPWGTDQTWVDEWYGPYDAQGRIFRWCMSELTCIADYLDAMDSVADTLDTMDVQPQAADLLTLLQADIDADPRREFGDSTHQDYVHRTYATMATTADRIRDSAAAQRTALGL